MRATRNNIFSQIEIGIKKADKESRLMCQCSINKNTEAFLVHKLAEHIYKKFPTIKYRLEVKPKDIFMQLGIPESNLINIAQDKALRIYGAIDCCLYYTSGKKTKPAHLIEFKRGKGQKPFTQDIKRLAALINSAAEINNRTSKSRFETAYFITTTQYLESHTNEYVRNHMYEKLKRVDDQIQEEYKEISLEYDVFQLGKSLHNDELNNTRNAWAVIVEISTHQ